MVENKKKNHDLFGMSFTDDVSGGEETAKEERSKKDALNEADILKMRMWIEEAKERLSAVLSLLDEKKDEVPIVFDRRSDTSVFIPKEKESGRVIEGVFDGQNMIGPDGKEYSVPANYASKSKLVEGDILKLTITPRGSFIYKQIHPVERERIVGTLRLTSEEEYVALAGEKKYKLLKASVTYFKGNEGDEAVLLVPKDKMSVWAAVENIVKG